MATGDQTGRRGSMSDLGTRMDARMIAAIGVMLAVVFVMTRFVQISIGAAGYIHLGDIGIYVTAFLFGPIVGLVVGGVGTALADLQSGYAVWAPGSFVIHGIQAFIAGLIAWRAGLPRMIIGVVVGGVIVVAGYFLYMWMFAGALDSGEESAIAFAVAAVWLNTVQVFVGAVVSIPVVMAVRQAYPPIMNWGTGPRWVEEK